MGDARARGREYLFCFSMAKADSNRRSGVTAIHSILPLSPSDFFLSRRRRCRSEWIRQVSEVPFGSAMHPDSPLADAIVELRDRLTSVLDAVKNRTVQTRPEVS